MSTSYWIALPIPPATFASHCACCSPFICASSVGGEQPCQIPLVRPKRGWIMALTVLMSLPNPTPNTPGAELSFGPGAARVRSTAARYSCTQGLVESEQLLSTE